MKTCPNCNENLHDDAKFCGVCGAQTPAPAFCTRCGNQISSGSVFCETCGAPTAAQSSAEATPAAVAPVEAKPAEVAPAAVAPVVTAAPKVKKKFPKKALIFGLIGVAVVAAIVVVLLLIFGKDGKAKDNYTMYLKDNEIFITDLRQDSVAWQVTDRLVDGDIDDSDMRYAGYYLGRAVCISENGKYVFYPDKIDPDDDNGFNLYYRSVSMPDADAVKIDSDVRGYVINDSVSIVTYIKGSDKNLYQYNLEEDTKDKIASEVKDFVVSDDGSKIGYINSENSIYLKYAGKDREKLASDVSSIEYVSKDITTVYYIKEDSLYKQVEGEDKEKIASDVYNVIKIYESGEIYYLTKEETTASLMDYVDDDMKEADASIVEPEYPDYPTSPSSPSWWDYDTDEEYDAAYEAYEKAYEEWEAEYDRMQEEYYAAREAYYDKQSRDELREDLEDETINQTTYSLYFYDGTKDTMITDSFAYGYYYSEYYSDYNCASDAPVITYETCKTSDIEKTKLSEIEGFYSFENTIDEALSSASRERYIAAKSNAVIVEQEKNATNFKLNSAGTVVYYIDDIPDEENYGELYCISINDGKIGKAELYDSDVRTGYSYFANENDFVYFKDVKDGKGELYINKNRIDYDVECYSVIYDSESGKTVYLTDYNSEKDYGTLKIHDGKKATKIADDVHTFYTTPEGRVLYLYDYSLNYYKGELCEWYNGETRHIDEDVNGILITNDGAYMDY